MHVLLYKQYELDEYTFVSRTSCICTLIIIYICTCLYIIIIVSYPCPSWAHSGK